MLTFSSKGYRASRKFQLKYGFAAQMLADGLALALNHDQLAEFLDTTPAELDQFFARINRQR